MRVSSTKSVLLTAAATLVAVFAPAGSAQSPSSMNAKPTETRVLHALRVSPAASNERSTAR